MSLHIYNPKLWSCFAFNNCFFHLLFQVMKQMETLEKEEEREGERTRKVAKSNSFSPQQVLASNSTLFLNPYYSKKCYILILCGSNGYKILNFAYNLGCFTKLVISDKWQFCYKLLKSLLSIGYQQICHWFL